eukprot:scaffold97444_cov80-Phaeocystis_antarctica.AAC.2
MDTCSHLLMAAGRIGLCACTGMDTDPIRISCRPGDPRHLGRPLGARSAGPGGSAIDPSRSWRLVATRD